MKTLTEAIDAMTDSAAVMRSARIRIQELTQQRDELLEALEYAKLGLELSKPAMGHYPEPNAFHKACFEKAEALITKVNGAL